MLDGEPEARPFRHIFVVERAPWHTITDDMPQFEQHDPDERPLAKKKQG